MWLPAIQATGNIVEGRIVMVGAADVKAPESGFYARRMEVLGRILIIYAPLDGMLGWSLS
jgi:hypothetical protein